MSDYRQNIRKAALLLRCKADHHFAANEITTLRQQLQQAKEESERVRQANIHTMDVFEDMKVSKEQAEKRVAELEEVATSVRRDLILRAEPDWDGSSQQVVNLSAGIWDELNRVLDIKGNRRKAQTQTCTYPNCRCPFDKGQDDPCLKNLPLKPQVVR